MFISHKWNISNKEVIDDLVDAGLDGIQFSIDGLKNSHERMREIKKEFLIM